MRTYLSLFLCYAMLSISSANIGVTQTFNQDLYLKPNKVCLKTYPHTNFRKIGGRKQKFCFIRDPIFDVMTWVFDFQVPTSG